MPPLTELAHQRLRGVLRPGDIVVDATAGNGRDTRFLAELVGLEGTVYALDLQPEAISRTTALLQDWGLHNVRLIQQDHAELLTAIPTSAYGRVSAVMFNLGYLPGGDKAFITRVESTLRAINASLEVLRSGGLLTVLAYSGHPGGSAEADAVANYVAGLHPLQFDIQEQRAGSGNAAAPRLFVVRKR